MFIVNSPNYVSLKIGNFKKQVIGIIHSGAISLLFPPIFSMSKFSEEYTGSDFDFFCFNSEMPTY